MPDMTDNERKLLGDWLAIGDLKVGQTVEDLAWEITELAKDKSLDEIFKGGF